MKDLRVQRGLEMKDLRVSRGLNMKVLRDLSSATACVATSSASEQRYVEMGHLAQSEAPLPVTTSRCSHPCLWLRV